MRLDTRAFTSKVARRTFVLFVTCALVPVSAIAALGFWQVTSELHAQNQRRLQQASKAVAMVLFQRLQRAEAALATAESESEPFFGVKYQRPFTGVLLATDDGRNRVIFGALDRPPTLTRAQQAHLAAGKTVLSTEGDPKGPTRFFLSRSLDRGHPERGTLHGAIDPPYLWVIQDEMALPPDAKLIVLDPAGRLLFSSFAAGFTVPEAVTRHARERTAGYFEWTDGPDQYLASHWSLFLRYGFGSEKWTIVLNQPKADVVAPIADFKRTFFLVVLLTVWMVLLLSVRQIRKNLTPLDTLQEGTRRLAQGQLDARVEVTSGDEFQELAASFNRMATQLGRQFDALAMRREISATLNPGKPLDEILQACGDLLARHLDLALVGIWTVESDGTKLALRASAGGARNPGEAPSFPISQERLTALVRDRRPYATNTLGQDPQLGDSGWAAREGLLAFAAHPLLVEDRLVGVAATFATHALDGLDLGGFGAAAGDIARCIDRKRVAEALQDSEGQMRQLQKMEAVGQLAGGIAHDFNNLLTVILGRSAILLHGMAPDHPSRKHLRNIEETGQRAAVLTRQLLAFSRKQALAPAILDLGGIVLGMKDILHQLVGANVELAFVCPPDLGRVKVDGGQAEQVVVNLVVNARDAMPDGGLITLQTSNVELDELEVGRLTGLAPGPHVMLAVTDTGTGMDAPTLARIFEPFFTTKDAGKGTGLGLATVYGIIRQSGGGIAVESVPGAGTTFRIYFPRVDGAIAPVEAPSAPAGRGTETVLLVEDDGDVRALIETVLGDQGYAVLAVARPREAVRIAQRHSGPIHLLLTDMVMPEMSATELARQLITLRPKMAVLYMSGYTDYAADDPEARDGPAERSAFLQKPFTPDAVARAVRAILDAPTPLAVPAAS